MLKHIGIWAFMAGIVLAIIGSFLAQGQTTEHGFIVAMIALGIIVGLLNIEEKESMKFLIASLVMIATSGRLIIILREIPIIKVLVVPFFTYILAFVGASASVVSIKELYSLTKD